MHGQQMGGVEELVEDRKVRTTPPGADNLIGKLGDDVVQQSSGKRL
jgi:hypothetical protein